LLTCYDLRFPVFSRYGRAGLYDGIILVANWPEQRQPAWEVLTRARAMENQCYVLAVNRAGSDPVTTYVGGSMVKDPIGRIVTEAEAGRPSTVTAQPDIEKLRSMRQRFRVLSDRDT
jgi:predicted amidohydrolase